MSIYDNKPIRKMDTSSDGLLSTVYVSDDENKTTVAYKVPTYEVPYSSDYYKKPDCPKSIFDLVKIIHVPKKMKVHKPCLDKDSNDYEEVVTKNGMTKCFFKNPINKQIETVVSYVDEKDEYDEEKGLLICLMKYFCGNSLFCEEMNFWNEKYKLFPVESNGTVNSKEMTENLYKLHTILKKDKSRALDGKTRGLKKAKFYRRTIKITIDEFKYFKKMVKKYFKEEYPSLIIEGVSGSKECWIRIRYKK